MLTIQTKDDYEFAKELSDRLCAVINMDTSDAWDDSAYPWGKSLWDAIKEYEARPKDAAEQFKDIGTPADWYTVLGFIAEYDPERLRFMDSHAHVTAPDGRALSNLMRDRGWDNIPQVTACAALIEQGIERVHIYPVALLRSYFGLDVEIARVA